MSAHNVFNQMGRAVDLKEAVVIPTTNVVCDLQGMDFPIVYVPSTMNVLLPNMEYGRTVRVVAASGATATVKNASASTIGTVASGETGFFTATATSGTFTYLIYGTAGAQVTPSSTSLGTVYTSLTTTSYRLGIPMMNWRIASTGAVGTLLITDATPDTGGAGLIASTTAPTLTATNGATDPTPIITWAASVVTPIFTTVPIPADFQTNIAGNLQFGCLIKSGGTTNAVGFNVNIFGETGSDVSAGPSATATNQTTTYADKLTTTVDISGGGLSGSKFCTVVLTPVTHGTDTMVMKDAWLIGTKKLVSS